MIISSSVEYASKALSWLAHGEQLAVSLKGEAAKHSDVIWQLIVEAVEITDNLPDQERKFLTSGNRSGGWNQVGMTPGEAFQIEKIRMLCAMRPNDSEPRFQAQRNDLERAMGVLEWMRWIDAARLPKRLRKAAIAMARGGDEQIVHTIYCPNRGGRNRQISYEIKSRTAGFIMNGLKKDLHIVPDIGIKFKEVHSL